MDPGTDPTLPSTDVPTAADAVPQRIGRYTIEHIVGAGGMGVVYAAYDPDLERRVAVKVIRGEVATPEQRGRLLREARALAKLAHRHVVVVHEVATDAGVDFIVMELVEGDNLAGWLQSTRRTRAEVLRAFHDAGTALAAAHAAGMVHRDFKPHNVLVARDGRVVVTDFGLARAVGPLVPAAVGAGATLATAATMGAGSGAATDRGAALTRTGAMVGTPAYMPPEQFAAVAGDPRGDQYSFCVAAWEGLTGSRPFVGSTIAELHRAMTAGVPAAAGRGLPAAVRRVLARGLSPDPDDRWPTMTALLSALRRAERGPRRIAAVVATAAVVGAALAVAVAWPSTAEPSCPLEPAAIDRVWSPSRRATMSGDGAAAVTPIFDRARGQWLQARAAVCAAPGDPLIGVRTACLRDAAERLDALVGATIAAGAGQVRRADLPGLTPEPEVCLAATPPTTPAPTDRDARARVRSAIAAFQLEARSAPVDDARISALLGNAPADCAARGELELAAIDALVGSGDRTRAAEIRTRSESAAVEAARCGHDAAAASALVVAAAEADDGIQGSAEIATSVTRARAAVERAGNPVSLVARLALIEGGLAMRRGEYDPVLRSFESAARSLVVAGRSAEAATFQYNVAKVRMLRGGPGDLDAASTEATAALATLREQNVGAHRLGNVLRLLARIAWERGDRDQLMALRTELQAAPRPRRTPAAETTVEYRGRVVDGNGGPVSGAVVAAAPLIAADHIVGPWNYGDHDPGSVYDLHQVISDDDGRYRLDAVAGSMIIADHQGHRSRPAVAGGEQTLRLEPGGQIQGSVVFASPRHGRMSIVAVAMATPLGPGYAHVAPIGNDGRFRLLSVPPGRYQLWVQRNDPLSERVTGRQVVVAAGAHIDGVELPWKEGAARLEIVLRADRGELDTVAVTVFRGRSTVRTWTELAELLYTSPDIRFATVDRTDPDATARGRAAGGDLVATIDRLESGAVTACATPLSSALARAVDFIGLSSNAARLDVTCETVTIAGSGSQTLVIDVAPMRRLAP